MDYVTASGCEFRVMGKVTKDFTAESRNMLSLYVNQKVIILSQEGDNYKGFVTTSPNSIGLFPKNIIEIIGEINRDLELELYTLERQQLIQRAQEEGIPNEEVRNINDEDNLRSLIIQKIIEKESLQKLRESRERSENLQTTLEDQRSREESQANTRRTRQEGNYSQEWIREQRGSR